MIRTLTGVVLDGTGSAVAQRVQPIVLPRGEHAEITINVLREDGSAFPLGGYSMTLRIPSLGELVRAIDITDPDDGIGATSLTSSDTSPEAPGVYPYFVFIVEDASGFPFLILPASPLRLTTELYDSEAPITSAGPAQQLVGMPTPTPSYNARPYFFGGLWRFQQYERAKATFVGQAAAIVTWPTFEARPFEVRAGAPKITDAEGPVVVDIEDVTPTGCLVQLSDVITGEVHLEIEEVLS